MISNSKNVCVILQVKLKKGNLAGNVSVFICKHDDVDKIYQRMDLSTNDHVILYPGNNCILWDFEKETSVFKFWQRSASCTLLLFKKFSSEKGILAGLGLEPTSPSSREEIAGALNHSATMIC